MRKLLWLIPILLLVCCAPNTPQITNIQTSYEGSTCTITWETDVPTTSMVMLCDEEAGFCQWWESKDSDCSHWFIVDFVDTSKQYKVTLAASNGKGQGIAEINIGLLQETD